MINVADYFGIFIALVNLAGFYPWGPARITPERAFVGLAVIAAVTAVAVVGPGQPTSRPWKSSTARLITAPITKAA